MPDSNNGQSGSSRANSSSSMPSSASFFTFSETQPASTSSTSPESSTQNSAKENAASSLATKTENSGVRDRLRLTNSQKIWAKRYRTEISASTASLASTLAAYPLDSVKTRMQAYRFPNFADCVRHTYRTEGLHGFWRGVVAPLASITLVRTVSFSIYQKAKYTYDDWITHATGESPLVHANTKGALPSLSTITCFGAAGATSGALITTISCPFELTKLSAQISVLMANDGKSSSIASETGGPEAKSSAAVSEQQKQAQKQQAPVKGAMQS